MANTCKNNWAACGLKRILDIMLAIILLVLFSPLFLICWLMVKIEDRGSASFKQERIGRNGKPFVIYKLRTMQEGAEESSLWYDAKIVWKMYLFLMLVIITNQRIHFVQPSIYGI